MKNVNDRQRQRCGARVEVFDLFAVQQTTSVSEQNDHQLCVFSHTTKLATHPTIKR